MLAMNERMNDRVNERVNERVNPLCCSQPKSYEFGYAVKDAQSGNDFGRRESSDGDTVRGEYRVQLPDGRTQIVTYTADWRTGFHADVRYEGVAQYPDQYNTGNNGGYNSNAQQQQQQQGYDYSSPSNHLDSGYNHGGESGEPSSQRFPRPARPGGRPRLDRTDP